jgi:hypothetical protein
VSPTRPRRRFTAAYKSQILRIGLAQLPFAERRVTDAPT